MMKKLRLFLVATAATAHVMGCGFDTGETDVAAPCAKFTPIHDGEGFVLDEGRMTLHPGQEGIFCTPMRYPAGYEGKQVYITGVNGIVPEGTHHYIMAYSHDPFGAPPLCPDTGSGQVFEGTGNFQDYAVNSSFMSSFDAFSRITFGGGQGAYHFNYPDGYGRLLPLGYFESSHHVQNPTTRSLEICAKFNVRVATAEAIRHPMAVFVGNALGLSISPHSEHIVERTLVSPFDMDVVMLMSHAHKYLTKFEMFAYRDGETTPESLYVSSNWNNPLARIHDPPVHIKTGDGITYRCTYNNVSDGKLTFGIGDSQEMCMPYGLYAYPPDQPLAQPPELSATSSDSMPVVLKER
jgi:hypothetical protein